MQDRLIQKIKQSGLFDADWYRNEYPDVVAVGMDPLEHYLRWGWRLGRRPSARFDVQPYVEEHGLYPGGMNPLLHFLNRIGERRSGDNRTSPALGQGKGEISVADRKLPLTALVIAWDIGHNPLGRAYMLAEVLDRVVRNVILVGFQHPRYGKAVWEPVRRARIPVIGLPAAKFPEALQVWDRISKRFSPDVVIACKPRLPSLQLGAMIRLRSGCPMVLDIDDHELSFFKGATASKPSSLDPVAEPAELSAEPYEKIWTEIAHSLIGSADHIMVSNWALQREFGGTLVPHVRDEKLFDPSLHDRRASRAKFGVPASAKVTLFLGTPRAHKGIKALASAIGSLPDPAHLLVIVGTATDKRDIAGLHEAANGRTVLIPDQPFSAIPEILSMADIVCLPQDQSNPVSRYQLPAKAIDAIAMGVPLLVVPTEPLQELILDGLATPVDPMRLGEAIARATDARRGAQAGERSRNGFLSRYSYSAAARTLRHLMGIASAQVVPSQDHALQSLLRQQRRLYGDQTTPRHEPAARGKCVVLFWKQNDTTLYGRRHDMVISYLASRGDIRKVVVFDAPISEHELLVKRDNATDLTQDRDVYVKTYQKAAGALDTDKISYRVLVYPVGGGPRGARTGALAPSEDEYCTYVAGVLADEGVIAKDSIFWLYPRLIHAKSLISRFSPSRVVIDVVDDHRAWPNVSERERDALTLQYRELLGVASMAFANCQPLVDAMREFKTDIRLVPNGCDDRIATTPPVGDPIFDEIESFPGKVIGFVGNLETKLDLELIRKISARFSDGLVVLIGSTHANPEARQLAQIRNVRMPGVVPYDSIGAWVSNFDVGIIPHLDTGLTKTMNPLKQYVYLALGVPIVCTEVKNIDLPPGFVRCAETHEDFLDKTREALDEGSADFAAREKYIEENSWKSRLAAHVDELFA